MTEDAPKVLRRGYRFSILPEWVLYHRALSDKAVRLFAIMDRFAGEDGACWPSRKTLAGQLSCSVDTIDRVKAELVDVKALEVETRPGTSNRYILNGEDPSGGGRTDAAPPGSGSRTDAALGGRTDAAQTRATEPDPPSPPSGRRCVCGEAFADINDYCEHIDGCAVYLEALDEGGTPASEIPTLPAGDAFDIADAPLPAGESVS